jgi:predicted MFS family arabinose efflux permease
MGATLRSLRGLDCLSFFLANVRDGLGPYLAIFLLTEKNWNTADIGLVMGLPGFTRILVQTPSGAWIDQTHHKRKLIVFSSLIIGFACLIDVVSPTFLIICLSQIIIGLATSVYTPTVAAITLGMVGYDHLAKRIGRNESFNHIGNVLNAILAGAIGYFMFLEGIFYLVTLMAIASSISVLMIKKSDIDHSLARGAKDESNIQHKPLGYAQVVKERNIIIMLLTVTLFGFCNGSMMTLVGQKIATIEKERAYIFMSCCIIIAQLVMIIMARVSGKLSENRKRKSIFMVSFIILPLRAILVSLTSDPIYLTITQLFDGIAGGIFGVMVIIIIADLTEGTGRFNFIQGVVTACIGIGTGASAYVTGQICNVFGYNNCFLVLAVLSILTLVFVLYYMPETKDIRKLSISFK